MAWHGMDKRQGKARQKEEGIRKKGNGGAVKGEL